MVNCVAVKAAHHLVVLWVRAVSAPEPRRRFPPPFSVDDKPRCHNVLLEASGQLRVVGDGGEHDTVGGYGGVVGISSAVHWESTNFSEVKSGAKNDRRRMLSRKIAVVVPNHLGDQRRAQQFNPGYRLQFLDGNVVGEPHIDRENPGRLRLRPEAVKRGGRAVVSGAVEWFRQDRADEHG
ncbi:hypothetical protein B0H16DRAFT_1569120 [Mycena metata]|uniref:Uncharacterized protein n=1 Tax=Mycena metata TaxID=1033252 RepID=A0AAD7MZL7_9AGAR|nr:hypothetical protein B0H16DRAFT_1569120 [Mycena metata]